MSDNDKEVPKNPSWVMEDGVWRMTLQMSPQEQADLDACYAIDRLSMSLAYLRLFIESADNAAASTADGDHLAKTCERLNHTCAAGQPLYIAMKNVEQDGQAVIAAVKHMLALD